MKVKHKMFSPRIFGRGEKDPYKVAEEFATGISRENLINITNTPQGTVVVWYWG